MFPKDFIWGAASSSYQIEGAALEDGKGKSVWDVLTRKPGFVWSGHQGDVACDHYHRYREDVGLMSQIGLQAYRLSISWPRVLPEGTGKVNTAGLDFYDRVIDALLEAHISPHVTLFHWDFPYALYQRGGWLSPDSPDWFAEFTQAVVDRLSDRVRHWMTQNEPQCFIGLSLQEGIHAPGLKLDAHQCLTAAHHALLAHGKSVQVIRARAKTASVVGYATTGPVYVPASENPADVAAARQIMFAMPTPSMWSYSWFMDPIYLGQYPQDGLSQFERQGLMPAIGPDDMQTIYQPLDFFGVNLYNGLRVRAGADGKPEIVEYAPGHPHTAMGWVVIPELMYWAPKFLSERYKQPVIITENGLSCRDWISMDQQVHDPLRIDFLRRHLLMLHRAINEGVPIEGYFHWSIMDNFEWAEGYRERFGLVYVDFADQRRILKDSAHFYAEVIRTNGASLSL